MRGGSVVKGISCTSKGPKLECWSVPAPMLQQPEGIWHLLLGDVGTSTHRCFPTQRDTQQYTDIIFKINLFKKCLLPGNLYLRHGFSSNLPFHSLCICNQLKILRASLVRCVCSPTCLITTPSLFQSTPSSLRRLA